MSEEQFSGSCVCGVVTYTISPPFMAFQYCHCSRCRKASGAAYAANLFVPTAQFEWTAGEDKVRRFELPTAKYWSHCFCDTCGSALPYLTRTGKAVIIPAGTLDDDPGERPNRSIMWGSRSHWYESPTDLETHDEYPPRK